MKKTELDKKLKYISSKLYASSAPARSLARIDPNCFTEQEKLLFAKADEILSKNSSENLTFEQRMEEFELVLKANEIIVGKVSELFIFAFPRLGVGDEVGIWFFNQYFYNFLDDYVECVKVLYQRSEKERQDFLCYLKENDKLNAVYRIKPSWEPKMFTLLALSLGWDDLKKRTKKRNKQGDEKP